MKKQQYVVKGRMCKAGPFPATLRDAKDVAQQFADKLEFPVVLQNMDTGKEIGRYTPR